MKTGLRWADMGFVGLQRPALCHDVPRLPLDSLSRHLGCTRSGCYLLRSARLPKRSKTDINAMMLNCCLSVRHALASARTWSGWATSISYPACSVHCAPAAKLPNGKQLDFAHAAEDIHTLLQFLSLVVIVLLGRTGCPCLGCPSQTGHCLSWELLPHDDNQLERPGKLKATATAMACNLRCYRLIEAGPRAEFERRHAAAQLIFSSLLTK